MAAPVERARAGPLRLVLVDDHEMVRRGLASLFGSAPDVVVVGQASTAAAGLDLVAAERPDVVLIDIVLPDRDGIALCRDVRSHHPAVGCLLLTAHDESEAQLAAVLAGAAGHLTKDQPGPVMLDAIRQVAAGRSQLNPALAAGFMTGLASSGAAEDDGGRAPARLTAGERDLLDLVADRQSDAEIAARLTVSERAVRTRIAVLFTKLGLARRISADVHGRRMVYRPEPVLGGS